MYLVNLPEGKKDIVDVNLAYQLGHEQEDSETEILKHDDYTLVLKGTLLIQQSNGDILSGKDAFERLGQDRLENGLDSMEPSESFKVIDSPRFEWVDDSGYSVETRNTISANVNLEIQKLKDLLSELYG